MLCSLIWQFSYLRTTVQLKMLAGENIGEFNCLDYFGENFGKWFTNKIQIFRKSEGGLVIGHQFTNVFSHQHFLLYGMFFILAILSLHTMHSNIQVYD